MRMFDAGRPTTQAWLTAERCSWGSRSQGRLPYRSSRSRASSGSGARCADAHQPGSPCRHTRRQGAHRGRLGLVSGQATSYQAAVWDPVAGTIVTQPLAWDMFCNAMSVLPDGRVFINGGNLRPTRFGRATQRRVRPGHQHVHRRREHGARPLVSHGDDARRRQRDDVLGRAGNRRDQRDGGDLHHGLWVEPGVPGRLDAAALSADASQHGRKSLLRGLGQRIEVLQSHDEDVDGGRRHDEPRQHEELRHLGAASAQAGRRLPAARDDLRRRRPGNRDDGDHRPVGSHAGLAVRASDVAAARPDERDDPAERQVLALGGSAINEDAATKSLNADLYDPATNTFSSAGMNAHARAHSGSLLLPDATVALVGGNPKRGTYEKQIEIYSPAYLFNSNGSPAARPTITGVAPGAFELRSDVPGSDAERGQHRLGRARPPGAQTHSIDMEQRLVGLNFTAGDGVLNVTAPPHGTSRARYYMLFVLNSAGVPSVAKFVRSRVHQQPGSDCDHQQPRDERHGQSGRSRFFLRDRNRSGRHDHRMLLDVPGRHAFVGLGRHSGNVVYSTPGTYTASFRVTDNGGLVSPPATRTITVADFTLSAPTSRTVAEERARPTPRRRPRGPALRERWPSA